MDLLLKKEYRYKLKKPLGKLIKNDKELIDEFNGKKIITVGDMATQTILKMNLKPKLAIVDYKIERKKIKFNYKGFLKRIKIKNPAGTISKVAINKIKEGLKLDTCLLEVNGEEDLLVIPSILESKLNSIVLYGQPEEGIVIVNVTKNKKKKITELLKECFKN
jgi:hypothetical protein